MYPPFAERIVGCTLGAPYVNPALYLRSVCRITTAFRGLRCHPLTCMLLNLRLNDDSSPTSGTINFRDQFTADHSHSIVPGGLDVMS
jgi:hypothetical protein